MAEINGVELKCGMRVKIYKDNSLSIFNKKDNLIYSESSYGYWIKREYDINDNEIYYENSDNIYYKTKWDKYGNLIYFKSSDGCWWKKEYDKNNNQIYFENSSGVIMDNRKKKYLCKK